MAVLGGRRIANETSAARAARYGLVAAWNLEDVSDSYGANTLTNNNAATFAAGKLSNAVSLVAASTQSLSITDNAALSTGDVDFWFACWFNMTTNPTQTFAGKESSAAVGEWRLDFFNSANRVRWITWKSGAADAVVTANTFGAPSTGVWIFALGYSDAINGLAKVSLNGGAFDSVVKTGPVTDTAAPLTFGASFGTAFCNGLIDAACFGKSPPGGIAALATELRDYLYNSGNGRQYPSGWT